MTQSVAPISFGIGEDYRRLARRDVTVRCSLPIHRPKKRERYRRSFGRGQVSPRFPLARTKAPREGLPGVSPGLDERNKGLEVNKPLLDLLVDFVDDLRDSLVK